jgi:hypothetical protein
VIGILAETVGREIFKAVAIATLSALGAKAVDEGVEALKRRREEKAEPDDDQEVPA